MEKKLIASDGHKLDCWMVAAQRQSIGGLVILQEIFGVTDKLRTVAERYAALGYDVALPALFDRQNPGVAVSFDNAAPGRNISKRLS